MVNLILKRILVTIPVLILISLVTFYLKKTLTSNINQSELEQIQRPSNRLLRPVNEYKVLIPSFYFSVLPHNFPDTLYLIPDDKLRYRASKFLKQGVKWPVLKEYLLAEQQLNNLEGSAFQNILQATELKELSHIQSVYKDSISVNNVYANWSGHLSNLIQSKQTASLFIPSIRWYGPDNGYHRWVSELLRGNWGKSSIDHRPAWIKIKEALSWTLALNLFALFFIYLIAVILGEFLFSNSQKKITRWLENGLLFFYSIPRFFLAMILIFLFASNTFFPWLHIFPTPGFIDFHPESSFLEKWTTYGGAMILPLICMILPSLAYISRLYANKLSDEKTKPYAFMAWARGISQNEIVKKHLRKNALIPIITLIGMEIPSLIGGSVVIEVLFNIPGMGRLMMQSIILQDWVVVFDILLLTGLLTITGKLFTDLVIRLFDPRIV